MLKNKHFVYKLARVKNEVFPIAVGRRVSPARNYTIFLEVPLTLSTVNNETLESKKIFFAQFLLHFPLSYAILKLILIPKGRCL